MKEEPLHVFYVLVGVKDRNKVKDLISEDMIEPDPSDEKLFRIWDVLKVDELAAEGAVEVMPLPEGTKVARVRFQDVPRAAEDAQMKDSAGQYQVIPLEGTNFKIVDADWLRSVRGWKVLITAVPEPKNTSNMVAPDVFLVGDRQVFDANGFAKWLLTNSGNTFVTLSDTREVQWYDSGIYVPTGAVKIEAMVEEVMDGFKITRTAVNEVIGHVQRRTYVERDEFDKDKRIINLENGLYDSRTGELKPHTPDYLSTVRVPVTYDPDATCPVIDQFMIDVLDADDIETAWGWFGYALEPAYWIQSILMLLGEGSNGKSKFLGLLGAFVGEKNCSHESIHQLSNNRFRVANLYGKLANIYADVSEKALKETGILKTLSGEDKVSVEKKGVGSFDFLNFARMIFSANRLPRADDDTEAWYRRWTFLNFTRKFGGDPDAVKKADKHILDKLTTDAELSGLLNHALTALRGLHKRGGFSKNLSTDEARRIYQRLSDPVSVFIEDCCVLNPEYKVAKTVLFNAYVGFCESNRQVSIGQSAFTRRIRDLGKFTDCQVGSKGKQGRGWKGLNIDGSIFDSRGNTVGNTLGDMSKTATGDTGNTLNTLLKPLSQTIEESSSNSKKVGGKGFKSVLTVLPAPTDSDSGVLLSVLPSVLPDSCGHGSEIMAFITQKMSTYPGESPKAFDNITGLLEKQGYDSKAIEYCIKRYEQGHRIHVPRPESE